MYSIVLMAAMTTGSEVPDFGRRRGGGCSGCYGGGYVGCSGCYGGWGGGYGCRGGGYRGCYGGGYGGCHGGGYGGCWGGGYGGCYGGGYAGCYGGSTIGYGGGGGWSSNAGYGGYAISSPYPLGAYVTGGLPVMNPAQTPYTATPVATSQGAAPATLIVNLPADAKLTVDQAPTQSTSARRVFVTPPLEPGKVYTYTLRAQVNRDGQTFTASREVNVRPGQETQVTLDVPTVTASVNR
jgi:uncharacterized protein (TIGR03000 family)